MCEAEANSTAVEKCNSARARYPSLRTHSSYDVSTNPAGPTLRPPSNGGRYLRRMNMRLHPGVVGTLVLLLFSLPSSGAELTCDRRPLLGTQPRWISSAEFNPYKKEILIADPSASEKGGALLA